MNGKADAVLSRDLRVNLRRSPFPGLCPFVALPYPAFPLQGNHFHLRSYTTPTRREAEDELSLSLGLNYFLHSFL